MRLVMVMALAGLVALPLSVSAQTEESEEAPKQAVEQEPAPSSEPATEEPALQLQLDDAGVEVAPSQPRTIDGYTVEEMELRVKRARIGLLSTTGVFAVGVGLTIAAAIRMPAAQADGSSDPVLLAGLSFLGAGTVGMITSGGITAHRAKALRRVKPLDPRVRRPRIGILSSTGVFLVGGMLTGVAGASANTFTGESLGVLWAGVGVASAGLVGMLVSGTVLGVRKRKLRELQQANYGTPRRVQWDLVQSRFVF